ncbi:transposase [Aneurinibacillus migulanus]|uniref:transposase n=1 Tax=Aneurinibacillus migulanus TaxID=47500 RepID=UPI000695CE3C
MSTKWGLDQSPCVLFITKEQDTTYAATLLHTVQPGDLLLRDLGYSSLDGLKSIHEQGGYYISGSSITSKNDEKRAIRLPFIRYIGFDSDFIECYF